MPVWEPSYNSKERGLGALFLVLYWYFKNNAKLWGLSMIPQDSL